MWLHEKVGRMVVLGVAMAALYGCASIESSEIAIVEPLTAEEFEEIVVARRAYCEGTVSATGVPSVGFTCSASECRAAFPVGAKVRFKCDGTVCPVKANTWYRIRCDDGPIATRCKVKFSSVTACQ